MTSWIQIFLDTPADRFEEAVAFWSAVTAWAPSERRGEDGQFLTLLPAAGSSYLKMQAVDGPGGVHLDLDSSDRPAAIERARSLGATTAWTYHDVEVMRSPGGFVFCHTLVDGSPAMVRDGSTILDQVEDLGPVRQILPTHYIGAWVDAFNDPIVWTDMARGVVLSIAYAAVLLALAWRKFLRKDVLS